MLVDVERGVPCALRDGTVLAADVWRPRGTGPFPVLLVRLPYNKATGATFTYAPPPWYAARGYIVVVQDVRGRHASGGDFVPLVHEVEDGEDAVAWAARLPGADGRVGMYGGSYLGWVQLAGAVASPPALRCIAPAVIAPDGHRWAWRGGAFNLHFARSWMLEVTGAEPACVETGTRPLREAAIVADGEPGGFLGRWIDHPDPHDPFWQSSNLTPRLPQIDVPGLHIGGWYDMFVEGTIRAFADVQEHGGPGGRSRQRLHIGPWWHFPWCAQMGDADFGDDARNTIDELQIRWFDRWLGDRRNGVDEEPAAHVFVMGTNRWWAGDTFPPPARSLSLYLTGGGRANGQDGDGQLAFEAPADDPPDAFYYDPAEPTSSLGGRSCCFPESAPMGPYDQRPAHRYPIVLVYRSEPLRDDLCVMGAIESSIHLESTALDTDVVVQLCDEHPDGRVLNVLEGIQRTAGAPPPYRVELGMTAITFRSGHRIRIAVTSSLYPAYDRNHNDGGREVTNASDTRVVAWQTVHHDAARPSSITLPVVGV